ncbi:YbjQ family protein [Helicovermis profundi]|uniref:UPF0145 protein HLPR_11000 n=1 Tax=Helicovermis profundi TaxID=3065157 RepID=A0AAU9EL71_9FIRM|nr:YbjQ family protein [Clostridia bacterium S502]
MIIVNTDFIANNVIVETLGVVQGSTIRSKNIGKDILSGFRTIVGGELSEYTEMLTEARQIAVQRMVKVAEEMNADAIINLRFATSAVMQGAAEILAYGTAVKIEKK